MLNDAQLNRYARQILLDEVGEDGQERLRVARVLVVGAGGLGVPVASYLAAAGVGTVGIADSDRIAVSNLPRQIAYAQSELGDAKTERLRVRLRANNPDAIVVEHPRLAPDNVHDIVAQYDLVADGCDNFPTRYLVNAACVQARKPLVSGALSRFTGQLAAFVPGGACYQCVFPEMPDRAPAQGCVDGGILGPMAGLVGCWQALEVLKQLLESPGRLDGELMIFDGLAYRHRRIRFDRSPGCVTCSDAVRGEPHGADSLLRSIA